MQKTKTTEKTKDEEQIEKMRQKRWELQNLELDLRIKNLKEKLEGTEGERMKPLEREPASKELTEKEKVIESWRNFVLDCVGAEEGGKKRKRTFRERTTNSK